MFYYKITIRTKRGSDRRTTRNVYREFSKPAHVGEYVGSKLAGRGVTSVGVTKISQAAYLRKADS